MSLSGKKVFLRAVEEEDIERFRNWRNQEDLRKFFREYKEISKIKQKKWFEKIQEDECQFNFAICVNVKKEEADFDGEFLIGHCGLYYANFRCRYAEFGIYVGSKDYRDGGYGSDALRVLCKYGFENLNMNKIWAEVYDNNEAYEIYKHIGFKDEGILRDQYYDEGKYWDSRIISMLRSEYDEIIKKEKDKW